MVSSITNYWNDAAGLLESISIIVRHSETSVDFFVDGLKKIGTLIPVPSIVNATRTLLVKVLMKSMIDMKIQFKTSIYGQDP